MADATDVLVSVLRNDAAPPLPRQDDLRSWEHLLVRARDEGLCGMLLRWLTDYGCGAPGDVLRQLTVEKDHVAATNRLLMRHIERLSGEFAREGVDLIVLKGGALVLDLYDDAGLRPMCDVDLLVRRDSAVGTDRLLRRLGYARGRGLVRDDFYPLYYYEAEYLWQGCGPVRLDVHVRPWRPMRYDGMVDDGLFWESPKRVGLGQSVVAIPRDEHMLVHLLCHAAFHGAERLLWLVDIHRLATERHEVIDWPAALHLLRDCRLAYAAGFALKRVEAVLGSCVPAGFRDGLKESAVSWKDRLALWQAPRDCHAPLMHTLVDVLCTDGWSRRLGYVSAVLLPNSTHMGDTYEARHPGWLLCAHARRALTGLGKLLRPAGLQKDAARIG
ncbi:MAG: nucleotidyltransferase family protein [Phycisphaerae bacterium]